MPDIFTSVLLAICSAAITLCVAVVCGEVVKLSHALGEMLSMMHSSNVMTRVLLERHLRYVEEWRRTARGDGDGVC